MASQQEKFALVCFIENLRFLVWSVIVVFIWIYISQRSKTLITISIFMIPKHQQAYPSIHSDQQPHKLIQPIVKVEVQSDQQESQNSSSYLVIHHPQHVDRRMQIKKTDSINQQAQQVSIRSGQTNESNICNFQQMKLAIRQEDGGMPFEIAEQLLTLSPRQTKTRLGLYFPQAKQYFAKLNEEQILQFLKHAVQTNKNAKHVADGKEKVCPSKQKMANIVAGLLPTLRFHIETISQRQLKEIYDLAMSQYRKEKFAKHFKFDDKQIEIEPSKTIVNKKKVSLPILRLQEFMDILKSQDPGLLQLLGNDTIQQQYQKMARLVMNIERNVRLNRRTQAQKISDEVQGAIEESATNPESLKQISSLTQQIKVSRKNASNKSEQSKEDQEQRLLQQKQVNNSDSKQKSEEKARQLNTEGLNSEEIATGVHQDDMALPDLGKYVTKRCYEEMLASNSLKTQKNGELDLFQDGDKPSRKNKLKETNLLNKSVE